ncbi:hypothetical protein V8E51_013099 [Hyaloscypha variabilis]
MSTNSINSYHTNLPCFLVLPHICELYWNSPTNPQCANQSWNLYDNGGYFCCEQGFTGYASTTNSDGCAEPGYAFQSGEVLLPVISSGIAISITATSSSTTTTSNNTPKLTSSTNTQILTSIPPAKQSNTGPIAGGVVGGVVRRKRVQRIEERTGQEKLAELHHTEQKDLNHPSQVTSKHSISELAEHQEAKPGELWDPHSVSELA